MAEKLDGEGIIDPEDVAEAELLWNDIVDVFHSHNSSAPINAGVLTLMLKKIFEEAATREKEMQQAVMQGARILMLAATPMPEKGRKN